MQFEETGLGSMDMPDDLANADGDQGCFLEMGGKE